MSLIDNLQVARMPGHSIKQRAQRKIAVELAQITQGNKWTCSVLAYADLQKCPHGDKYCMFNYKYKYLHVHRKYKYEYKYFKTVLEYNSSTRTTVQVPISTAILLFALYKL